MRTICKRLRRGDDLLRELEAAKAAAAPVVKPQE